MANASGVKRFELPPAKELEPLVAAHRKAVEDDLADPVSIENGPSFQLSKAVLGPVLPLIPSGSKVVIVPDGVLHRVNFETLPIAAPKPHYWIEDVVLSIAPSLSVLANAPAARAGGAKSLLLFGAPTTADPLFPTPSYAAQESSNVQKYFNGAKQVFTGAAATPDAYKSGGPERFDLIHFAAHAEASQVSPLDSSVILARGRDGFRLYVPRRGRA
jgi:CHAT domain-containing protein